MYQANLAFSKPIGMSWHFSSSPPPYIFCTVAPTSENVPYQYRCFRQNKSQMNKNEAMLKSYRFFSPSIMTTGRKSRKIDIAVKAKAEG